MWGERGPVLEWLVGGMWVCVCVYIYVYELVGGGRDGWIGDG